MQEFSVEDPSPNATIGANGGGNGKIGVFFLVILAFFCVSGGPYGIEISVSSAPPFIVMCLLVAIPWLWCMPIALSTAELSCAFPDEGGGSIEWAKQAFSAKWGKVMGFLLWVSCTTDNALYPALLPHYIGKLAGVEFSLVARFGIGLVACVVTAFLNFAGIEMVGVASIVYGFILMTPIVCLVLFSIPYVSPDIWFTNTTQSAPIEWNVLLALSLWSYSGFDDVGTLVQDVKEPTKTFPRAMFFAVLLVMATNALPTLFGICVDMDWANWGDGHFGVIAQLVGGNYLRIALAVGAIFSLMSNFNVLLLVTAKIIDYMSGQGWLPRILSIRSSRNAPTAAITLATIFTASLLPFDFELLAEIHEIMYCIVIFMNMVIFVSLRFNSPNLHRPYKVPVENRGALVLAALPTTLVIGNLWLSSIRSKIFLAICAAISIVLYFVSDFRDQRKGTRKAPSHAHATTSYSLVSTTAPDSIDADYE